MRAGAASACPRRRFCAAVALAAALGAFVALPALHLLVHAREARLLSRVRRAPPAAAPARAQVQAAGHGHDGPSHDHGAPGGDRPHGQGAPEHLSLALLSAAVLPAPAPAGLAGERSVPATPTSAPPRLLRRPSAPRAPPAPSA